MNQRLEKVSKTAIAIVLYCILLFGGYFVIDFFNKQDYSRSLSVVEKYLGDSLTLSRNHLNQEEAKRVSLELSYKELQNTTSHELGELRKLVDKQTKSLHILKNSTSIRSTSPTKIDTVLSKDFPTYSGGYEDQWMVWDVVATPDSIINQVTVYNYFEIRERYVRKNVFHPYTLHIEVLNRNPHTTTHTLSSFSRKVKEDRWILGPQAGVGFTSNGFGGWIGVGVTYKVLGW